MRGENAFKAYYQAHGLVQGASEWDQLMSCLTTPLPVTFTVVVNCPGGLGRLLLHALTRSPYTDLVQPISWYPNTVAFQVTRPRSQWPDHFTAFLKAQTEIGTIIRQELVSMVPAVLLCHDLDGAASVLDLCAAPGSKTSQLAQICDNVVVVANDCDARRASMLMNRLRATATSCLVVTRCDAAVYPAQDLFDRVLCDVPCSGDGTIRKAPKLLRNWKSTSATALHRNQISIAHRAFLLTRPGGRMIYSTCSLNPIENEAVVLDLLNTFGDEIDLVDVSEMVPGLNRSPGVTSWTVMVAKFGDVQFQSFTNCDDARQTAYGGQCAPSMFASGPNCSRLSRCVRLLPHQNDSGGFFIALIERRGSVLDQYARLPPSPVPLKLKGDSLFPFIPLLSTPDGVEIVDRLRKSIGLRDSFPFADLHVRKHDDKDGYGRRARLYLLTEEASSQAAFHSDCQSLMHAGLRTFERCVRPVDVPVEFRICWEAIEHILPHLLPDRIRSLPLPLLLPLLRTGTVDIESIADLKQALVGDDCIRRDNLVVVYQASPEIEIHLCVRVGAQSVQMMSPARTFDAIQMLLT